MYSTSLNVSQNILIQIYRTALLYNIPKCEIFHRIMLKCQYSINFGQIQKGLTAYQKKAENDSWKCMRIDLNECQCNVYLSYRNRFRISLSKLFSVSFSLFFLDVLDDLQKKYGLAESKYKEIINSYTVIKLLMLEYISETLKIFKNPEKYKTQTSRNP